MGTPAPSSCAGLCASALSLVGLGSWSQLEHQCTLLGTQDTSAALPSRPVHEHWFFKTCLFFFIIGHTHQNPLGLPQTSRRKTEPPSIWASTVLCFTDPASLSTNRAQVGPCPVGTLWFPSTHPLGAQPWAPWHLSKQLQGPQSHPQEEAPVCQKPTDSYFFFIADSKKQNQGNSILPKYHAINKGHSPGCCGEMTGTVCSHGTEQTFL